MLIRSYPVSDHFSPRFGSTLPAEEINRRMATLKGADRKEVTSNLHLRIVEENPLPEKAYILVHGSRGFWYDHIETGKDILSATNSDDDEAPIFWLRCDWDSFEIDPEFSQLSPKTLADKDLKTRLNYSLTLAQKLLGKPDAGIDFAKTLSYSNYLKFYSDPLCCIKPLSQSIGQAECIEYSLIVHKILEKMGIPSSLVLGSYQRLPNSKISVPLSHAYLVLNNGELVFDPLHSIVSGSLTLLEPIYKLKRENLNLEIDGEVSKLSPELLSDQSTEYKSIKGVAVLCRDLGPESKFAIYGSEDIFLHPDLKAIRSKAV